MELDGSEAELGLIGIQFIPGMGIIVDGTIFAGSAAVVGYMINHVLDHSKAVLSADVSSQHCLSCARVAARTRSGGVVPSALNMQSGVSRRERGFWPADKGAAEWGKCNNVGAREGRGRFHGIKQNVPDSKATDEYSVNPDTGDVAGPNGKIVGNRNDVKSK